MKREELLKVLSHFVVEGSENYLVQLLIDFKVQLKITRPRSTKFGDYRPPSAGKGHRITVNGNLNKYAFTVTLVHEIAHLVAFEKHGNRHQPHGVEWKNHFKTLLMPLLEAPLFPRNIRIAALRYIQNPSASSCTDPLLFRSLHLTDNENLLLLERLPLNTVFVLENGRIFIKGEKLRRWYRCVEFKTGKIFRISGVALVKIHQTNQD